MPILTNNMIVKSQQVATPVEVVKKEKKIVNSMEKMPRIKANNIIVGSNVVVSSQTEKITQTEPKLPMYPYRSAPYKLVSPKTKEANTTYHVLEDGELVRKINKKSSYLSDMMLTDTE